MTGMKVEMRDRLNERKTPTDCLKEILVKAFPGQTVNERGAPRIEGIEFRPVREGDWYPTLTGVQLQVYDRSSHCVIRRVMLSGGEIDLDKLRAKHDELKKIGAVERKASEAEFAQQAGKTAQLQRVREAYKIEYPNYLQLDRFDDQRYSLILSSITEAQLAEVMQAYWNRLEVPGE